MKEGGCHKYRKEKKGRIGTTESSRKSDRWSFRSIGRIGGCLFVEKKNDQTIKEGRIR